MGRFKYIPQEYNLKDENSKEKAIKDSDLWEINIKRNGKIVDNTLMVYNDYKIPLDVTENLANDIKDINEKIYGLYQTMEQTNDLLESTSDLYEIFENKVFGKALYDYETCKFNNPVIEPMPKPNGDSKFNLNEIKYLDMIKSWHEYNKHYISKQYEFINDLSFKRLTEFTHKSDIEIAQEISNKTENTNYEIKDDESDVEYELNIIMENYSNDIRKIVADVDYWNERRRNLKKIKDNIIEKENKMKKDYMMNITLSHRENGGDKKQ